MSVWSKAGLSSKATVFLPSLLKRIPGRSHWLSLLSYLSLGIGRLDGPSGPPQRQRLPFVIIYVLFPTTSCLPLIPVFILPKLSYSVSMHFQEWRYTKPFSIIKYKIKHHWFLERTTMDMDPKKLIRELLPGIFSVWVHFWCPRTACYFWSQITSFKTMPSEHCFSFLTVDILVTATLSN